MVMVGWWPAMHWNSHWGVVDGVVEVSTSSAHGAVPAVVSPQGGSKSQQPTNTKSSASVERYRAYGGRHRSVNLPSPSCL
eukprot:1355754-Rhodomonas_salina.2